MSWKNLRRTGFTSCISKHIIYPVSREPRLCKAGYFLDFIMPPAEKALPVLRGPQDFNACIRVFAYYCYRICLFFTKKPAHLLKMH